MPAIVYEFSAAGQGTVVQAIKSTAQAEEDAAQRSVRAARRVSDAVAAQVKAIQQANQRGAQSAARSQVREYEQAAKVAERTKTQETRAAERSRQQELRQQERVAQQQERFRQREAQQQDRARQQEARAKERDATAWNRARQRAVEKAMATETRAAEKTAKEQARIVARQQQQQQQAWHRYEQERLAVRKKYEAAAAPEAQGGGGMSTWEIAKGTMVGGLAARGVMMAIDTVKSAARGVADLQEAANRTSINARQAGQGFVSPEELISDVQKAALGSPGQKAADIMQALQSFVSLTGELKTGRESAGTFATVAAATGSNVGDVSQAAASIYNQFGLKTKEEMQDVLASLTFQGKTGAFELRDAASQFQRLAAAGASFGLSGAKGVKTIGGLAQIARTGTGSAEQTTTAIENIFSNLIAKSAILKQQGVRVYDKSGKTRDVTDVLLESIVKAGKNNFEKKGQILQQVFGDQGIRGVRPLLAKYQTEFQGVKNKGGTDAEAAAAGLKRLREEIDKSVNAPGAWDEVQRDAAQAAKDVNAQTTRAFEAVQASLTKTVMPAVAAFAVALDGVVKYLTEKGLLKGPEDDVDVKRNRQTLDQLKAREKEMLSKGPIAPEDVEEFNALQDQIAKAELRNTSDEDLQRQHDAIYGNGGSISDVDAAQADALQAEINRRAGYVANPEATQLLSQEDFVQGYVGAGAEGQNLTLAKMRAGVFANAMQGKGEQMPEWMYRAMGETDEERGWRDRYKTSMAEGKKGERPYAPLIWGMLGPMGDLPGDEAKRVENGRAVQGGNELVNAANELRSAADALRNASQPSITGVSGPSTAPGG
jgi:chemotaxis protein histidine kinase CheA